MSFGKTAVAAAIAGAALILSSAAHARPMSIRELGAQEARLAAIAHRISGATAATCPTREPLTGLILHDLTRYDPALRPVISKAFSMSRGFGVLQTVPGSAAEAAGLRTDDEILAIGRFSVEDGAAFQARQSYSRTERFRDTMQLELRNGSTDLLIRRAGNLQRVRLQARYGCGGQLALMNSSTLNAWADGKHVIVTTGMTALSRSDDEIAFVIAHEMAHNILGHSHVDSRKRGIFGLGTGGVRRAEIDADSHAVQLMANAGYQPAGAITFLQNARRRLWWNVSLSHPGFGKRIQIVADAMRGRAAMARSNEAVNGWGARIALAERRVAPTQKAPAGADASMIAANLATIPPATILAAAINRRSGLGRP